MDQMTSHVIAYRSLELLFGTHTFHFNCFFEDFNCVFMHIRCLSRVLDKKMQHLYKIASKVRTERVKLNSRTIPGQKAHSFSLVLIQVIKIGTNAQIE